MPGAARLAVVGAVVAGGILLALDRGLDFVGDDWTFVAESLSPPRLGLLAPHNEHWVTLHRLLYDAMLQFVGLRSYLPYLAVLVVLHLGAALALFALVRRRAGDVMALSVTAIFLLYGRGAENLTWAFQVEMVAPVLCGLGAMLLLEDADAGGPRLAAASALLLAAVMSSSAGIVYAVAVGVELALDPPRRRRLLVLLAPAAAYVAWFVIAGRTAIGSTRSPLTLEAVRSLELYVPVGVGVATAAVLGLPPIGAVIAPAVLALLVVRWVRMGRVAARTAGALAGVLALFVVAGLVRAQFGIVQAASSRYVYLAAPLLFLVAADAVAELPLRRAVRLAVPSLVALSLVLNVRALVTFVDQRDAMVATQTAQIQAVGALRGAPDLDTGVVIAPPFVTPITAGEYYAASDRYGPPVPPVRRAAVASLPATATDDALRALFGRALRIVGPAAATGCAGADPAGDAGIEAPAGGRVLLVPEGPGRVRVFLWSLAGRPDRPTADLDLPGPAWLALPDTGSELRWRVAVAGTTPVRACPAQRAQI